MKRNRLGRRGGLPRDAEQLLWLANGLADSSSRAEDHFWDQRLADAVDTLLRSEDEDALNTALDHLSTASAHAYDELADMIESRAEGALKSDEQHDVLLIAAPVMAWSRYRIPAAPIAAAAMSNLRVQLKAHVLAKDVRLALADFLFSPDQLPQGYCATADFATHLGKAAGTDTDLHIKTDNLPETAQFLSDTRYLLGAVMVPKGAPIFRWQEEDCTREQALDQWRAQGGACVAPLLTGCAFEVVLPNAYFAASREAGLRVGLATDIGAGTGFSLLRTLAQAYEVGQACQAPLSALRGFYLATLGGAQALYLDDCIGSFQPGREADFIALDWAATPELAWRMERTTTLAERLFALMMLGDERCVVATHVMGEVAFVR